MNTAMKQDSTLKVTTPSEREIAMTRLFDAPRNLVFDALTQPDLVKRWGEERTGKQPRRGLKPKS